MANIALKKARAPKYIRPVKTGPWFQDRTQWSSIGKPLPNQKIKITIRLKADAIHPNRVLTCRYF